MNIRAIILIILLFGLTHLQAQKLRLGSRNATRAIADKTYSSQTKPSLLSQSTFLSYQVDKFGTQINQSSGITPLSYHLFPDYVKKNPRGYSYLCRLELKVEEQLPIGVWLKFGENNGVKGVVGSPANLRMKLVKF